jgi:K+-sensing histidine kinase KdpD
VAATAALVPLGGGVSRDYVFIYLAVVAVLAVVSGLGAATCAALVSFLLVDYFFVAPVHTLTIADQTDVINLIVFVGTSSAAWARGGDVRSCVRRRCRSSCATPMPSWSDSTASRRRPRPWP